MLTQPSTPVAERCDVVVIGGGPAGSTAANLIAQRGHKVQLFEREAFPRFHIGESLMPETYWTFQRLGVLPKLRRSEFVKKYSVQFVSAEGKESQPFYFFHHNPHESAQTWQVLRSEFDQLLLEHAAECGVTTHVGMRVLDVLFEGARAVGVKVQDRSGNVRTVTAQVVVDASGQSSHIARRLKRIEPDPVLKKATVWTYFEGARREAGIDEGATLVLSTQNKKGWFWYIPLHRNIMSVGVVSSMEQLFGQPWNSHEEIFWREVERCPSVKKRIARGKRVADFYTTKDFSYRSDRAAGDGWVLVGDAFGFLDPIYSSGVFLALKSGEMAADAVCAGLARGDTTAAALGCWQKEFETGMDRMKRLVYAFYEGFSFGRFIRKYPQYHGHIVDLLIGNLFKDYVDEVIGPMDEMRAEARAAMAAMAAS